MSERRVILWFRQDLRLHDNEALQDALASDARIYPVYIFDERAFHGKTRFGFPKTGEHRAQFILESVTDLRQQLQSLGSDLIVRFGKPEDELFAIAQQMKTSWIFCNRERTEEEVIVQDRLEQKLWSIGQEMRYSRGKMLYYTADLPFPVTHTPDSFATFKKEVERFVQVRKPFEVPKSLPAIGNEIQRGVLPTLEFLTETQDRTDSLEASKWKGGENAGIFTLDHIFENRNNTPSQHSLHGGLDQSLTSLSPYLSVGCLSPKRIFHVLSKKSELNGNQILFEHTFNRLMYRDYLRLMAKKHGNRIFQTKGVGGYVEVLQKGSSEAFTNWMNGTLGEPLIDAILNKLNRTGFCNNQARMLAANYLIFDLGIDWRKGASYFESKLIDYDPCSNWVNWMMIAGVGPDHREQRKLNYSLQAQRLDPKGTFIERWS